jgi:nitroimidazol reductase NimA-like FMN-containing flavoprotein (pyridoxamine 5'-phosphate oxidase superfamily)
MFRKRAAATFAAGDARHRNKQIGLVEYKVRGQAESGQEGANMAKTMAAEQSLGSMLISKMSPEECREFLASKEIGRLACTREGQPYIVPIYFVYDSGHLYGFTTPGQKVQWMRENPLICVQADEVASEDKWTSVIVLGRYEELAEYSAERNKAQTLLLKRSSWWTTAYAASVARARTEAPLPVFYRIQVTEITGLRASPEGFSSAGPQ